MGTIELYAIILVLVAIIGACFLMFHLRRKWAIKADTELWLEMIPKDGSKSKDFMLPIDAGKVQLLKDKKGKTGKAFLVADYNTFPAAYPKGVPRFLQSTATKTIVYEESLKPAINDRTQEDNKDSSVRLFNILNERFSGLALEMSKTIEEYENRLKSQLNPIIVYLMQGLTAVGLIAVVVILFMVMGKLETIMAGFGL